MLCDRLANKIISPIKGIKEEIVHYSRIKEKKIVIVPNPIDLSRIQHLIREGSPVVLSRPAIVWAARLCREKDPGLMILAMKEVLRHRRAHLYIFGTGASERHCREVVSRLGLERNVHFMGFKKNIFRYMAAGDIFVHTCLLEGFGYSILEAMACGLPVIAENCPYAPREVLEGNRYGLLVPRDPGELARAVITLLDDEEKRNHYKKQSLARSRFFNIEGHVKEMWLQVLQLEFCQAM